MWRMSLPEGSGRYRVLQWIQYFLLHVKCFGDINIMEWNLTGQNRITVLTASNSFNAKINHLSLNNDKEFIKSENSFWQNETASK